MSAPLKKKDDYDPNILQENMYNVQHIIKTHNMWRKQETVTHSEEKK